MNLAPPVFAIVDEGVERDVAGDLQLEQNVVELVGHCSSAERVNAIEALSDKRRARLVHELQSQLRTGTERGTSTNLKGSFHRPITKTEPFQLPSYPIGSSMA